MNKTNDEFPVNKVREDFPILNVKVNSSPLVYLDNAATTQKPTQVINFISEYYSEFNSNVHRGIHYLSDKSTDLYESSRKEISKFINANSKEIIFTKGTTNSLNLVAFGLDGYLKEGDEIVISILEHHANFVVWQELCRRKKLKLKIIPLSEKSGNIDLAKAKSLITSKTKIISITACSNVLGVYTPLKQIINLAKKYDCISIVDAAQFIAHKKVDVKDLDCDFLTFSSHKLFGPTGVGVLYGKMNLLEKLNPLEYGGSMISDVSENDFSLGSIPNRFEAGTPNISGCISFKQSLNYLNSLDFSSVNIYEGKLTKYLLFKLKQIKGLNIAFESAYINDTAPIISFNIKGLDSYDVATFLNERGIAVRSGHHCAMPLLKRLGEKSLVRVSLSFYNTIQEIDILAQNLDRISRLVN